MLNFAIERKYISENPASRVRPFDERRERPAKRMLSLEEEQRILDNAPPYLRVAIVLLAQRVAVLHRRFFLSLGPDRSGPQRNFLRREDQNRRLIEACTLDRPCTRCSSQLEKEQGSKSPFLFPSPVKPNQPITTVKTAWKTTLKNAGVAHFPITI